MTGLPNAMTLSVKANVIVLTVGGRVRERTLPAVYISVPSNVVITDSGLDETTAGQLGSDGRRVVRA